MSRADVFSVYPFRFVGLLVTASLLVLIATNGPRRGVRTDRRSSDRVPHTAAEGRWLPLRDAPVDTLRALSRRVFQLTNRERRQQNLKQLERENELQRIACHHSRDMLARDYFQHENPDGERPSDRVAKLHRRLVGEAGENLWGQTGSRNDGAQVLARRVVTQWMNSPPHRENILRSRFTHMGVCILQQGNVLRGTQVFAHVRAYLRDPLPTAAAAGSAVLAPIEQTVPPSASVAKYDFWDPETDEQIGPPTAFSDTLRLPHFTGPVRPRFYVPESNRFSIHQGPEIRLTSPQ